MLCALQATGHAFFCNESVLPFNNLDDEEFYQCINNLHSEYSFISNEGDIYIFSPFEYANINTDDPLVDLDHDTYYYNLNGNSTLKESPYFGFDSFAADVVKHNVNDHNFFLVHMNIRSVRKNMKSASYFLSTLPIRFAFIGLTETWHDENSFDSFHYDHYNHIGK